LWATVRQRGKDTPRFETVSDATLLLDVAMARCRSSSSVDKETRRLILGILEDAKREIVGLDERGPLALELILGEGKTAKGEQGKRPSTTASG